MYTRKVDYFHKHLSSTEINRMFHGMRQHNAYRFPNLMPLQPTRFKMHEKSSYLRKPASLNDRPIQWQSNRGPGPARLKALPKLRAAPHSTITNHQVTRPRRLPRPPLLVFHTDTMAEQVQPTPPPSPPQNGNAATPPGKIPETVPTHPEKMDSGVEQQSSKGPISIRLDDFYGPTASDNTRTFHYHAPPEYEWISDAEDEETTSRPTMDNNNIEVIDLTITDDSPGCPAEAVPPQRSAENSNKTIHDDTPLLKQLLASTSPSIQPQPSGGRHQLYMGPYIMPTQAEKGTWPMRRNRSRPEIDKLSAGNKSRESRLELTFQASEAGDNSENHRKDKAEARRVDNAETRRVDNTEARRVDNAETRRVDNAGTRRVDNAETRRVDNTEAHRLDNTEAHRLDNVETRRVNNAETRRVNNAKTRRLDNAETRQLDNAETRRVDNAGTRRVDNAETQREGNPAPILIESNTAESPNPHPPSDQSDSSNYQRHTERERSQHSLILPCIHAIEPNPTACSHCNPRPQDAIPSKNSETANPVNYWRLIPPAPMQLQMVSQRPVEQPLIVKGMFPVPAYLNPVSTTTTFDVTLLPFCIPPGINNGGVVLYTN